MDGVCSCGSYKCLVKLYWKGKIYEFRRDDQGYIFTCEKAVDKLAEISAAIKKGTFNPADFTDANNISQVKDLVGHADIRTTQKYIHSRVAKLSKIVNDRKKIVNLEEARNRTKREPKSGRRN